MALAQIFMLLAAIASVAKTDSVIPLVPAGKWIVSEGPSGCRSARTFGSGDWTLRIVAQPITDTYLVSVESKKPIAVSTKDPVAVILDPGGDRLDGFALGFAPGAGPPKIVSTFVDAAPFDRKPVSSLRFEVKDQEIVDLSIDDLPALIAVLKNCEKGILARFGVDLAAQEIVAVSPKALVPSYGLFSNSDYPAEALRARAQGIVSGRFRVLPDGTATDCIVVVSSGNAALDQQTCTLLTRRARYKPAQDKNGKAVASAQLFSTYWKLP